MRIELEKLQKMPSIRENIQEAEQYESIKQLLRRHITAKLPSRSVPVAKTEKPVAKPLTRD